jgi:uncharacterized membrane protein
LGEAHCEDFSRAMPVVEMAFKQANYEAGVVSGIRAVNQHLVTHFPIIESNKNELPDNSVIL